MKIHMRKQWTDPEPDTFTMSVNSNKRDGKNLVVSGNATWLNEEQALEVHEFLKECISCIQHKPIRVYKRKPNDRRGFADYRPWNVGATPEDSRETCWESWEDAMHWATLPTEIRGAEIERMSREEGGW